MATAPDDTKIVPPLPTGLALTPVDATFRNDPYAMFERLRHEAPVHWDPIFGRWYITSADDVRSIFRNKDMSSDPTTARPDAYSAKFAAALRQANMGDFVGSMLWKDDPEHRRLRSLVSKPFGAKEVEVQRPTVRKMAEHLLDNITADKFDLIQALADPLPVMVIGDMLGVHPDKRAQFKQWSEDTVRGLFNPLRTAEDTQLAARAAAHLRSYFMDLIKQRRQAPGTDLISNLIVAKDGDSQPLTDEEVMAQCQLLLIAGNVTTTDFIGNAIRVLLMHPEQLAALRAEPELITNAMEEVLRYDSPVMQATRIIPEDMTFGGCPFHKGQSLQVSLASANRDPRANPDPDRFDIRRRDVRHQSFGGNRHLCLGAHLARLEAQEAVSALLGRYPKLELVEQEFQFRAWPGFRGTHQLWVRRA
jgi:hypothetical protein